MKTKKESRWEESFFVFKTKRWEIAEKKKNPPEILKRKAQEGKESGEVIEARENRSPRRSGPN